MQGSAHTQRCADCIKQTQRASLADWLMTQRAIQLNRQSYTPSPFFMAKLAARLRTEVDPYVLWENALPALRGWLLAFSAAALLLIAAAVTLTENSHQSEENVFTASANESVQNDAFWMGD